MVVLHDKNEPLTRDELQELYNDNCWTDTIPVKMAGGQVFCYSCVDETKKGMYNKALLVFMVVVMDAKHLYKTTDQIFWV